MTSSSSVESRTSVMLWARQGEDAKTTATNARARHFDCPFMSGPPPGGRCARSLAEIRREPALRHVERYPAAPREIRHLVLGDAPHRKVARLRMREVEPGHRRCR